MEGEDSLPLVSTLSDHIPDQRLQVMASSMSLHRRSICTHTLSQMSYGDQQSLTEVSVSHCLLVLLKSRNCRLKCLRNTPSLQAPPHGRSLGLVCGVWLSTRQW